MTDHYQAALEARALASRILGNRAKLAKVMGVTVGALDQLRHRRQFMPIQYVPLVVAACADPRITPYTLRPDLSLWFDLMGAQIIAARKAPVVFENPAKLAA